MTSDFIESYRGGVRAWECDGFGHFTVAYYFERVADASAETLAALGAGGAWQGASYRARFRRELRAGDGFHILSGPIAVERGHLRLGHKLFNSETGELATTIEEELRPSSTRPLPRARLARLAAARVAWEEGEAAAAAPALKGRHFLASARDRIKAWEVDGKGGLALSGYVHRTSSASGHLLAAVGMSPAELRAAKRGFATFEIRLELLGRRPRAGAGIAIETTLLRLGNSSVQMLHRLRESGTGRAVATLSQSGVYFDLATRRSSPIPPELRAKAAPFLGKRDVPAD